MLNRKQARNLNTLIRVKKDLEYMTLSTDAWHKSVLLIVESLNALIKTMATDNVVYLGNIEPVTKEEVVELTLQEQPKPQ